MAPSASPRRSRRAPGDRHRARRRLRQYRTARTGRAARLRLFRLRHPRRRRAPVARLLEHLRGERPASALVLPPVVNADAARSCRPWNTGDDSGEPHLRPGRWRRALFRQRAPDSALRGSRHADLGRPAARPLPVAARHAQPHAPAVVRRALEQAHRRPRLLLEEMQLLRCQPRLHRPLRRRQRHHAGGPHRTIVAETGHTGFPFRRRSRPAQGPARLAEELQRRNRAPFPGGATSASKNPSRRNSACNWPTAAASPSPAAWKWPPTACSN
jgi:hypothetical protein